MPEYKDLVEEHKKFSGNSLKIYIASGPFTLSENLEYEPLKDLLKEVTNSKPDILILVKISYSNTPIHFCFSDWSIFRFSTGHRDAF